MSFFELVEKLQVGVEPQPRPGEVVVVQWRPLRACAVWMWEAGDDWAQEYEHEFRLVEPQNATPRSLGGGRFRFIEGKPLHRFMMRFENPLPFEHAGVMRFEHRIRRVGAEEWQAQDYPVIIERILQDQPPPPAEQTPPG